MLSRMRKAKQLLLLQQGANRTSRPDRGDRPHGSYGFSRLNGPYRSNGPNWSNGAHRIRCGFSRMRLYTTDAQYSAANHPALSNE